MFRGSIPSGWVSTIGSADSNHSLSPAHRPGLSLANGIGYAQSGPILFRIRFPLQFQADLHLRASGSAPQSIVPTSRLALALLAGPMAPGTASSRSSPYRSPALVGNPDANNLDSPTAAFRDLTLRRCEPTLRE